MTFVTTANILEGVGVSAYTGAAAKIANDKYLTAAASILGVEGRHSSYFRASLGEVPFQPFEVPLDFDEVYTLASAFIASCPKSNGKLPVKAFPSLTATSSEKTIMPGSMVTLKAGEDYMKKDHVNAAFITVTGPVWADLKPMGNGEFTVTVPKDIMGQSYVVLTKGDKQVTDETICAGPAVLQVGPMVGTPSCTGNTGDNAGMMPSGSSSMPTGTMMPSGVMPSGSMMSSGMMMSSGSSMSSGSMPSGTSSSMPMYTGGAGKTMGNAAAAVGASFMVAAFAL